MKWLDKNGVYRPHLDNRYRINWFAQAPSKGAQAVKDFLRKNAANYSWYEEYRIPRTKLRVDFLCPDLEIAIEFQGQQHDKYNKFMHGTKLGFLGSLKRDMKKFDLLERNGIKLIEIRDEDLPLSRKWFAESFEVFF